jgi:heme-degrading monooxygenase HmoA
MAEMITSGVWVVDPAKHDAFQRAWAEFAEWASAMDGAETLRLGRDSVDPNRFVSFGRWDSPERVHAWKADQSFSRRMASVLQHVDEFRPTELDVVASASSGKAVMSVPSAGH